MTNPIKKNIHLLALCLFISLSAQAPKKINSEKIVISIENTIEEQNKLINTKTKKVILKHIQKKDPTSFNEYELYTFVTKTLDNLKPVIKNFDNQNLKNLDKTKTLLINRLKSYNIKGVSFNVTLDPNIGFFYDNINPNIEITYKNDNGNYLTQKYKSSISSIGFKIEAAFVINFIFLIGTDLNFFKSKKEIKLGPGVSLGLAGPLPNLTYSSIKESPGGILIFGIPIGLSFHGLNYVIGGKLKAK